MTCDIGYGHACYKLGAHASDFGNKKKADAYYKKACKFHNLRACVMLGDEADSNGHRSQAERYYQNGCFSDTYNPSNSACRKLQQIQNGSDPYSIQVNNESRVSQLSTEDAPGIKVQTKLTMPVSKADLFWFIGSGINSPFYRQLKKGTLYVAQFVRVIQKVAGGYIFTNEPPDGGGGNSAGYLKTRIALTPQILFCPIVRWIGTYSYTGGDGFRHTIPAFRVYRKEILNPTCVTFSN